MLMILYQLILCVMNVKPAAFLIDTLKNRFCIFCMKYKTMKLEFHGSQIGNYCKFSNNLKHTM